ncbi:MAG: hypothetical protein ACK4L8_01900 [Nitrincola lacisaponensis]|uniref:Uncharacterized protein n=1 Tax=Nitrincola lacisaponensis TaxID=267850 RepID=A0A063Y7H5_9GAMM|nr:hypothetical protein [Nitrincola lacisaponensis]KDE40362.1 hypothetical protein ADINL_0954 [Nitrincola lacisaponensis]
MTVSNNRLMLELEKFRREINRAIINPMIPELSLEDLKPLLSMVAHSRAAYVTELLEIAKLSPDTVPSADQIKQLRQCRETFDELVKAVNALETVIQRDYLDVKSRDRGL